MSDINTVGNEVAEEILKLVRVSQDTVVDAFQAWTSAIQSVTPSWAKVNLPYADQLPKPEALVDGAYDFAEQLLASQRKFAGDIIKVTAPLAAQGGKA